MIRDSYIAEEVEISECSGEVIWVKIQLKGENPLYVSSVYRQPSDHSTDQLGQLAASLDQIDNLTRNNPSATVIIGVTLTPGVLTGRIRMHHQAVQIAQSVYLKFWASIFCLN